MSFDKIYILDHEKLINLSLPTFLRGTKLVAWLQALFTPLVTIYNQFIVYKTDAIYRVSHNGSVTLLQKVLNDKFDNTERRIYIKNVQLEDALRIYYQASEKEVAVYTPAINGLRHSLSYEDQADFTVHVPIEYQSEDETELNKFLIKMSAQIDYYKLFAKKYEIQWIE